MILVQTKSTFPAVPDAMSAADDAMIDYPTPPDTPSETVNDNESCPTWLAMKFTLEIHVRVLSGHTDAKKNISYTFVPGQDDYTVGIVFAQAKNMYPTPAETRPRLSLCGCVLDDQSEEMYMKMKIFLHRKCADYNEDTAALQLDATLIFDAVQDQAERVMTAYVGE